MPTFKDSADASTPRKELPDNGTDKSTCEETAEIHSEIDLADEMSVQRGDCHSGKRPLLGMESCMQPKQDQRLNFNHLFQELPIATACFSAVVDERGDPQDFILKDVNSAFEKLSQIERKDIIEKSIKEVFPNSRLSGPDWIKIFREVLIKGMKVEFEQYSEASDRWFSVLAYCQEGICLVALFTDITEYKSARTTIRDQHDFLEEVKQSLTHPFFVIDASSYRVTMANEAAGFGTLREDSYCFALTHGRTSPCDGITHPCPLQEVKAHKKPVVVNHIHYEAGKNSRFVEIHAYPIFDHGGKVTKMIEYALDRTEKHEAEEALRESEKLYRTLVYSINDMIFVTDVDNRISQYYSSNMNPFLALPEGALGKSITEVLPADVARLYLNLSNLVRTTGNRQDLEYPLLVGKKRLWFLASLDLHEDGESIVSVVRDITKRKQIEEALKMSEASLAEAQNIAHLGNWEWDIGSNKMHWSAEMFNIFGVSRQGFSANYNAFLEFVHPNDSDFVMHSINETINGMLPHNIEHRIVRPDGLEKIVQERIESRNDYNGATNRLVGTVLDITERKITEKKLHMASKRAMLYLDLMGHDVTNQLQIVISCNALLKEITLTSDTRSLIEMSDDAIGKCQRIISKAKSTEYLSECPLIVRDLRSALNDCISVLRARYNKVIIESTYGVDEAPILADDFLECLIDNILQNAVQHNPTQMQRIWTEIHQDSDGFYLIISDNGPGIADQAKKNLFDLSRRFGGLGLHQVKEIVEKYSGRIDVCNRVSGRPEYGAKFRVWFPKATDNEGAKNDEGLLL